MLTIENYHWSDEEKKTVTDVHEFQDDDKIEIEMNIRYPVRFTVSKLKKDLIENGMLYNQNGDPVTEEEFKKNPHVDEMVLFNVLWQCMMMQAIRECYDEFDDETALKVYEKLKNSELVQILEDICRPMKVKKLSDHDLNKCGCCGPFLNPNFWSDAEKKES